MPAALGFAAVRDYIALLPAADAPELFGMNETAERATRETQARTLVENLLSVQPKLSANVIG